MMSDLQNRSEGRLLKAPFFRIRDSFQRLWGDMNSRFFRLLSDEYEKSIRFMTFQIWQMMME